MSHVIRVIRPTFVGLECHTCPQYIKINTDFKDDDFIRLKARCAEVIEQISKFEALHDHTNQCPNNTIKVAYTGVAHNT